MFFIDNYFQIKHINVIGSSNKQLIIGLSELNHKNLLWLDSQTINKDIIDKNSFIKSLNISKQYPNTLVITIEEQEPIASLKSSQGYFILSSDGRILKKNKDQNQLYPIINFYQQLNYYAYQAGHIINYVEINLVLKMINLMNNIGLKVNSIDIRQRDMIVFNLDNKEIILTTEKSFELQEYQLSTIIKQYRIEGKNYQTIDLRFDKPIIKL